MVRCYAEGQAFNRAPLQFFSAFNRMTISATLKRLRWLGLHDHAKSGLRGEPVVYHTESDSGDPGENDVPDDAFDKLSR